jgi:hypothetical protein
MNMAVFSGKNANMDYGNLELTEELQKALHALDKRRQWGSGDTYEICESSEDNVKWEAWPPGGSYSTAYYFYKGKWADESSFYDETEAEVIFDRSWTI